MKSGNNVTLLPPGALMSNANSAATLERRRNRTRVALVDIVFRGLGWLMITPVEVRGQIGWARSIGHGVIALHACEGILVNLREPLLPYAASGLSPKDFLV